MGEEHKHTWSNWKDDKPINIESQPELVILSVRHCTGCELMQPRIGRVSIPTTVEDATDLSSEHQTSKRANPKRKKQ